jgi:Secretion system C-terminal sorting domain/Outer membrane protein Omp28
MKRLMFALIIIVSVTFLNAAPRKVLLEIFTNSHCPLCPSAHLAIDSYLQNGLYKDQVTFIYYHMPFPYSDDALHQHNPIDASARNSYYGPFSSTPRGIFNGQLQNNSYSNWANVINSLAVQSSPFEITLQGNANGNNVTINASVKQTENLSSSNLVAHFIAVETVNYAGRNGITIHKNVMRKMFPSSLGRSFSISLNQTVQLDEVTTLNPLWNLNNLGYLVFIQDSQTKIVHQSEFITYNNLIATDVEDEVVVPSNYFFSQNYPNPFNPTTTINYALPEANNVQIKVYNLIGKEVAILADEQKQAGRYKLTFDASGLPSGVYFYRIQAGTYSETKRMILLK